MTEPHNNITKDDVEPFVRSLKAHDTPWSLGLAAILTTLWAEVAALRARPEAQALNWRWPPELPKAGQQIAVLISTMDGWLIRIADWDVGDNEFAAGVKGWYPLPSLPLTGEQLAAILSVHP